MLGWQLPDEVDEGVQLSFGDLDADDGGQLLAEPFVDDGLTWDEWFRSLPVTF